MSFKKRGAKNKKALSFEAEDEEEGAFTSSNSKSALPKKMKQAPDALHSLTTSEDQGRAFSSVGTEGEDEEKEASVLSKRKDDLRSFYQGSQNFSKKPAATVAMEGSMELESAMEMDEEGEGENASAVSMALDNSSTHGVEASQSQGLGQSQALSEQPPPFKYKSLPKTYQVETMSLGEIIGDVERARDALEKSAADHGSQLMRLESERERLLEMVPALRVRAEEEEEKKRGNVDDGYEKSASVGMATATATDNSSGCRDRTETVAAFRIFCAELVGMLRVKQGAVMELSALVTARLSSSSSSSSSSSTITTGGGYDNTEVAAFAESIFEDAKESLCNIVSVLGTFAAFRAAAVPVARTKEEDIAASFDTAKPLLGGMDDHQGKRSVYESAYLSLSLPDLLHPLITVDLLKWPLLSLPSSAAGDDAGAGGGHVVAERLGLAGREWYTSLVHFAASSTTTTTTTTGTDADGDGTLVVRVLLRSVLPAVRDTIQALAAAAAGGGDNHDEAAAAAAASIYGAACGLLREMKQQIAATTPSPCEATVRLKEQLIALVEAPATAQLLLLPVRVDELRAIFVD
jgi:hypothetical protein